MNTLTMPLKTRENLEFMRAESIDPYQIFDRTHRLPDLLTDSAGAVAPAQITGWLVALDAKPTVARLVDGTARREMNLRKMMASRGFSLSIPFSADSSHGSKLTIRSVGHLDLGSGRMSVTLPDTCNC